jgi:hypothetical protein
LTANTNTAAKYYYSLLKSLDSSIADYEKYDAQKIQKINSLKTNLSKKLSKKELHQTYFELYKEYETFVFDSAFHYAKIHLDISQNEQNFYWIMECKLELSRMYSLFAQFYLAVDIMNSIDIKNVNILNLSDYYNNFAEIYFYWSQFCIGEEQQQYIKLGNIYRDSALMVLPKESYRYKTNYGRKCIENHNAAEAEATLFDLLKTTGENTREYAIATSLVADYYQLTGNTDKQIEFLALSAITDIKLSIKENTSTHLLAAFLLDDGEITRADRYIKKSLDDANFFNARLRNIQIAKILPIIDKTYQMKKQHQQQTLLIALAAIAFLLIVLLIVLAHQVRQKQHLAKARRSLEEANLELKELNCKMSETSRIKEEYIGRFLNQCSVYIDKMEDYRKMLNKKFKNETPDNFSKLLKQPLIEEELKEFYQNFDSTFLNLFPDFVDKFNAMLPDEEKIIIRKEHCLSTELRVFALMRLGITDSSKIANFLRYSISTIYNYRSKYRNRSLVPRDDFEEIIEKL